jgi:Family of unknown function (DUF6492)
MKRFLLCLAVIALFCEVEGFPKNQKSIPYVFINEPIDVVIPCIEKDLETLDTCIKGIKENCSQIRHIYVVSSKKLTDQAIWFDEKNFPFSKKKVTLYLFQNDKYSAQKYMTIKGNRVGWYFQQLLKLYAPLVIPNISSNVLVLDADTIFLKPVTFLNDSGGPLFNPLEENHTPYFEHAARLTDGLVKRINPAYSGIAHHMLFQRAILKDLITTVQNIHGDKFWKAFCSCINLDDIHAGASEYEIYFNFALSRTDKAKIRKLKWGNIYRLSEIPHYKEADFDYVSCHDWLRK